MLRSSINSPPLPSTKNLKMVTNKFEHHVRLEETESER